MTDPLFTWPADPQGAWSPCDRLSGVLLGKCQETPGCWEGGRARIAVDFMQLTGSLSAMKVSLEHLFHYRCDACETWWAQGDKKPEVGQVKYCPDCGQVHKVEEIEGHLIITPNTQTQAT